MLRPLIGLLFGLLALGLWQRWIEVLIHRHRDYVVAHIRFPTMPPLALTSRRLSALPAGPSRAIGRWLSSSASALRRVLTGNQQATPAPSGGNGLRANGGITTASGR